MPRVERLEAAATVASDRLRLIHRINLILASTTIPTQYYHTPSPAMTILNVHAGSLPSFALRLKPTSDSLQTIRERSAAKVRLQLTDGIPLALKYGWKGQRYSLEDEDDWEIFLERVKEEKEADGELAQHGIHDWQGATS